MSIWAIADLHLSFGVPNKEMSLFGPQWEDHANKIAHAWRESISPDDLILIPGDISWGMKPEEAQPDLDWIERLPGTKLLLKGNHDYWWGSQSKVKQILPPSCHLIQNNSFTWKDVAIGGSRLWDNSNFNFNEYIDFRPNPKAKILTEADRSPDSEKILQRELGRLELSLRSMDPRATTRIAMTHYPPLSAKLEDSEASLLLEKYGVNICVFGHLHNLKPNLHLFGTHHGIQYYLTACDSLPEFKPIRIY